MFRVSLGKMLHHNAMSGGFLDDENFQGFADWVYKNCNLSFEPWFINFGRSDWDDKWDACVQKIRSLAPENLPYWRDAPIDVPPLPESRPTNTLISRTAKRRAAAEKAALEKLAGLGPDLLNCSPSEVSENDNSEEYAAPPTNPSDPSATSTAAPTHKPGWVVRSIATPGSNFTNRGTTCYINSVLQILPDIPAFRAVFGADWTKQLPFNANTGRPETELRLTGDMTLEKRKQLAKCLSKALDQCMRADHVKVHERFTLDLVIASGSINQEVMYTLFLVLF